MTLTSLVAVVTPRIGKIIKYLPDMKMVWYTLYLSQSSEIALQS